MSKHRPTAALAIAALAATAPVLTPLDGTPPPDAEGNAAAELVESDVVAECRRLREDNERHVGELAAAREAFAELRADHQRLLAEQRQSFEAAWEEREREIAAQLQAPPFEQAMASLDRPRRRAVFDASVPARGADGERRTFGPGDPVPDHIDPATLPEGAVRYVPEEG